MSIASVVGWEVVGNDVFAIVLCLACSIKRAKGVYWYKGILE